MKQESPMKHMRTLAVMVALGALLAGSAAAGQRPDGAPTRPPDSYGKGRGQKPDGAPTRPPGRGGQRPRG